MSKIPIVIIGGGVMGSNHARVVAASENAELVSIVDLSEATGKSLAAKYNAMWSPTIDQIPDNAAVIVASATESHSQLGEQLISRGIDLLIEKPLTDTYSSTMDLINHSRDENSVLMCGLLERFNPAILTAKQFISEPLHVSALRHSPFTPRIKTDVTWDLMIHDADIVLSMFGTSPTDIFSNSTSVKSPNGISDISDAILKFEGHGQAFISSSRVGQKKIRQISVSELDRLIDIDLLRRNVTIYRNVGESNLSGTMGYKQEAIIEIPELITSVEPLTAQFDKFISLIRGETDKEAERNSYIPSHEVTSAISSANLRGKVGNE